MHELVQECYSEPEAPNQLSEEPLVVHRRPTQSENKKLVIFVHGLGGSRYGSRTTWGDFPRFIFEDMADTDVGLYQYRTLFGRLRLSKSVSLEAEAKVFADVVRDQLNQYQIIVLIGHSMGGLLCKALIQRLVETRGHNELERIGGLILMATPQLGSVRVPGFLSGLTFDGRALKAHSDLVTKINTTFEDHIALDEKVFTLRKHTIPTWAVEGISDFWVDPLSSGIGLASSRRKIVRGSHTSIVKPSSKNSDAYAWVKRRITLAGARFQYDVFIAAAMDGHAGDPQYQASREEVLALKATLLSECGMKSVFYAGESIESKKEFDPKALALSSDLEAMRESRYFILYYPQKLPSSAIYEAGWALVLGKPSIYVVRDRKGLPFLLNDASQAFPERRVRVFECPDLEGMLNEFSTYGTQLFSSRDDTARKP